MSKQSSTMGCCRLQLCPEMCHLVPEGEILDGVLGREADAAEQDEEEDEVGEDVVVDDLVARDPEPEQEKEERQEGAGSVAGLFR